MSPVPIGNGMPETTSSSGNSRRFGSLRGVQWRIDLGILPSSPSASIDDIRRVTANSRRRYATLRRQILIDPNVQKDGSSSPDLVMDNPLSQNPDSMWGRFFRNAELERMVDQDLTRLYPERGSYFQTSGCQGMLRRILLLWCLRHPEYGYRQGMHELLAPLLYVLHVDVERLSEVRKTHDDLFADKFDGFSFHENDLTYKFDFKKFSESSEHGNGHENISRKASSFQELNPEIQSVILLSDAYGAEGELGIVLSEKFMEHDTYSMFDALMSGAGGPVSMAQFFSPSPFSETSHTGFLPVIEASAALYHVLSLVDPSLHSHLIELEVEPQYFALRWLRVLFGREFSLEDLLVIWDEIFAHENAKSDRIPVDGEDADSNFGILESPRGAFICSFAVSMILNLRSSILATEIATACLQRLLNFPDDVKIVKLLEKAKSLQPVALDANSSNSLPIQPGLYDIVKKSTGARVHGHRRSHTLSLDSTSPRTPLSTEPDSYWEEKWRVLHEEQKHKLENKLENVPTRKKGWSERVRLRLSRTESDPSPSKRSVKPKPSVRRSLLQDLVKQLGSDEDQESIMGLDEDESCDNNLSEENSSNSSDQMTSPSHGNNSDDNENESERSSSVASNSSVDENDAESSNSECAPLPVSNIPDHDVITSECTQTDDSVGKSATGVKEKRLLSGKFQWLWKFGRNGTNEGTSACAPEETKACNGGSDHSNVASEDHNNGASDTSDSSRGTTKGETTVDQNLMVSLKNLGQSMLENIQVIESVFQQDRAQTVSLENLSKNGLVGKGQVTAVAALKELRKISNLLSEM